MAHGPVLQALQEVSRADLLGRTVQRRVDRRLPGRGDERGQGAQDPARPHERPPVQPPPVSRALDDDVQDRPGDLAQAPDGEIGAKHGRAPLEQAGDDMHARHRGRQREADPDQRLGG